MRFLLLAFIVIPIVEMVVLIEVGGLVGVLNTILLVLLTAVIGVTLLKRQGLQALLTANQKMQRGEMPLSEIAHGLMLAVAGALLLTPGFVTDAIGFLLLTPAVRLLLAKSLVKRLYSQGSVYYQQTNFSSSDFSSTEYTSNSYRSSEQSDVIDGEFQDLTPNKDRLEK